MKAIPGKIKASVFSTFHLKESEGRVNRRRGPSALPSEASVLCSFTLSQFHRVLEIGDSLAQQLVLVTRLSEGGQLDACWSEPIPVCFVFAAHWFPRGSATGGHFQSPIGLRSHIPRNSTSSPLPLPRHSLRPRCLCERQAFRHPDRMKADGFTA